MLLLSASREARAQGLGAFEGRKVEKIEWEGLSRLSPYALAAKIETKEDGPLAAAVLSKDVERLFRTGEFESDDPREPPVSVTVVPANAANPGGPVKVVFHCRERPIVASVTFEDALTDALKRSEIEDEIVKTKKGKLYDSYRVAQDARELRAKMVEKGYLYAEVSTKNTPVKDGVAVLFKARPGPKVHVDEIIFEGWEAIDPSIVEDLEGPNAMETKKRKFFGLLESGTFDRRALRRDLDRVARYYHHMGYLDAKVYLDHYEFSDDRTSLKIHVRVDEGERYTVRTVKIVGAHVIEEEKLLAELKLRAGRPYLGEDLRADRDKIVGLYGDRAYIHCDVDMEMQYDVTRKLLDITFRINEGPKVRIDRIRIEGNDKTREDVIRRELSFYPGEYVERTKFEESLSRLNRTRFFKDVRWDFEPGSEPGREDIVLKVEEQHTGQFTIGGGVSTSAGFFGNISLRQNNFDITAFPTSVRDVIDGHAFSGAGQVFAVQFQPGNQRTQYSVTFIEPWLLGYPVIFSIEGFYFDDGRPEDWEEQRIGGKLGFGYHFTHDISAQVYYRLERVRVENIRFGAVPDVVAVNGNNILSAVGVSATIDKNQVDKYFVLFKGYSASATYEIAGLGGDVHYSKVRLSGNFQQTFFEFPAEHKWVLALTSEAAYLTRYFDRETPIFERFFGGGPHSIRGFRYRGVGPMFFDKPVGGEVEITGSAELSYPLFLHIIRGVVFLDAADVESSVRDVHASAFRVSAGFGARISLPIFPAPIALDFAWPLLRQSQDKTQVFSFSVGVGF